METQDRNTTPDRSEHRYREFGRGRVWAGLIVIAVGSIFLARQMDVPIPSWVISWPSFFIVLGLFIGAKHAFRDWGWIILVLIGTTLHALRFVDQDFEYHKLIWPLVIIAAGIIIIFKPRNREKIWRGRNDQTIHGSTVTEGEQKRFGDNTFENVNIFGGSKRVIISKDFHAGEVVTVFGGSEINFMQADINGRAEIELVQIFGGTKLIIPPNWHLQSEELVCIFGGVDDKRAPSSLTPDGQKVLVLKGTCIFGGIDIRSF